MQTLLLLPSQTQNYSWEEETKKPKKEKSLKILTVIQEIRSL